MYAMDREAGEVGVLTEFRNATGFDDWKKNASDFELFARGFSGMLAQARETDGNRLTVSSSDSEDNDENKDDVSREIGTDNNTDEEGPVQTARRMKKRRCQSSRPRVA
jgi:hypothetical protein